MARTERRAAYNACKKHSRLGCAYGVTGEYKRPARRRERRTQRSIIEDQLGDA